MALTYSTPQGTLTIPGAYSIFKIQSNPAGLAANGIMAVIGEADAGLDFSSEVNMSTVLYGPDQAADIIAKYKSGPLVDAFLGAVNASNDSEIISSFTTFIPVKTNKSVKATSTLAKIGGGTWSKVSDVSLGALGNLINYYVSQKTAEVIPTTGNIIIAPPQVSTVFEFRVDGGAAVTTTIAGATLPSAIVTAVDALAGVAASGGASRSMITGVAGTLTVTVDSGRQAHIVISTAWANTPVVGDILYAPTGSPLNAANKGTWVVTAATSTRVDCYKLLDATGAGAALTTPINEGPITIAAITDLQAFSPVKISNEAGAVVPGRGKTLEIAQSGANDLSNNLYAFTSASASPPAAAYTYVSTTATPKVINSAAEYQITLNTVRQIDNISEVIDSTSDIVLRIGYKGTTASAVIASGIMTITVTGGTGSNPAAITLANFSTINDLVAYIASLTGFYASAGNAALGQLSPTLLDEGTYAFATSWGTYTGQIKADGERTKTIVNSNSVLVDLDPVTAGTKLVGLPAVSTLAFLSGGTRGATANSDIGAALVALEELAVNFVVPTFSQDATLDIALGLTDSGSTYTIASINASVLSHVLQMSKFQERKPRQGVVSIRDTFQNSKNAASNLSSARTVMCFQDVKDLNAANNIVQFQPWMASIKAASMQLGGFYKALVGKFIGGSGVLHAAGDYKNKNTLKTQALAAGLLPLTAADTGGFKWVSDQTTYTKDGNQVYNSMQAMYIADVLGQTVSQRMELAFLGKNVADVSASLANSTLDGIMADMLRLKLTTPSDDAPAGYRNAKIQIAGPAMVVSLEIKLDTVIYFIPITFLVTPVSAG